MDKKELQIRIRQTLKNLESLIDPLKDIIRAHSKKIKENHDKNFIYLGELTTDCCRMVENFCFQFVLFSLEYIFTEDDYRFHFRAHGTYKMIVALFLERFKAIFHNEPKAKKLVSRMQDMKTEKDNASDEDEGFYGSSDEEKRANTSLFFRNQRYADMLKDPAFQSEKVQKLIQDKDDEILGLQNKLKQRERNLTEITAGYLKDLQNMRDQLFRKTNTDEKDFYEVQYFDISEIEDPLYLGLVNNRLDDLKSQYEKKTRELFTQIENQKIEMSHLNNEIAQLQYKTNNLNNIEYLANRLFQIETNPYKFWKLLQDCKGNEFFYEVFEKQKPQYGIKYREINKLLMQSKVYDKELEIYKRGIEEQMVSYIERAIAWLSDHHNEINQDQTDKVDTCINHLEKLYQAAQQRSEEEFRIFTQSQTFTVENEILRFKQLRLGFIMWRIKSKLSKQMDPMQLQDWCLRVGEYIQDPETLDIVNNLNKQLRDTQVACQYLKNELQAIKQYSRFMQNELETQAKLQKNDQKQIKDLMTKLGSAERANYLILKHLDPKIAQAMVESVNLDDEKRESTKFFRDKLKAIDSSGKKFILQVMEQHDRNKMGIRVMGSLPPKRDQSTITYMFDINQELDYVYNHYKETIVPTLIKNEQFMKVLDKVNEPFDITKDTFVQTSMKVRDIENIEQKNSDLAIKLNTIQAELDKTIDKPKINLSTRKNKLTDQDQMNTSFPSKTRDKSDHKTQNSQLQSPKQGIQPPSQRKAQQKLQLVLGEKQYLEDNTSVSKLGQTTSANVPIQRNFNTDQPSTDIITKGRGMRSSVVIVDQLSQSSERELNNISVEIERSKKEVFNRLFDDSKTKQKRIEDLKARLQLLEEQQWADMLSIMNHMNSQLGVSELQESMQKHRKQNNQPIEEQKQEQHQTSFKTHSQQRTQSAEKIIAIEPSPQIPETPSRMIQLQKNRAEFYFKRYKEYVLPREKTKRIVQPEDLFLELNQENYIQSQRKYIKNMINTVKNRDASREISSFTGHKQNVQQRDRSTTFNQTPPNIANFNRKKIRIMLSS